LAKQGGKKNTWAERGNDGARCFKDIEALQQVLEEGSVNSYLISQTGLKCQAGSGPLHQKLGHPSHADEKAGKEEGEEHILVAFFPFLSKLSLNHACLPAEHGWHEWNYQVSN